MMLLGQTSTTPGSSADSGAVDRIIDTTQQSLEDALVNIADLLPRIFLAAILVYAAIRVSQRLDPYVQTATSYVDKNITNNFTQNAFPNVPAEIIVSRIIKSFIILYAVFVASGIIGFSELTRELDRVLFYLPDLFGGIAVVVLSFGVGQVVGQRTVSGTLATDTDYATEIAIAVKGSIITIGTIIGLEMVGADLQIVYTLANGFAGAIGLGLTAALAIIIGVIAGIQLRDSKLFQQNS